MGCYALLPLLVLSSVTGCCAVEEAQATPRAAQDAALRRFRRGWIWKQFFVPEEDPAPQIIGELKSDFDKGDFSIKYLLSGEGAGDVFEIDEYSGEVRTLKKLDREKKAFYILRAQAINRRSNQPVEPESEFIVKVQDINDNMPQFQNEPYVSIIPEMSPTGTTVMQVTATDADDPQYGNNAKLIYSIVQGEPYFSVEPKTGIIVTSMHDMDREAREKYFVIVQVKDMMGLSGGFSATTTVTVSLSDVNDNGPIFQHNHYSFAVPESAPVGTTVGRIKADDSDVGVNARMNYSLEEREGSGTFLIRTDPVTQEGVILLAKTLDYETKRQFFMAADAWNDHVDTRFLPYDEFRDRTHLKIVVQDVDEPPVFLLKVYEWKIHENMARGTTVGAVTARDSDAADNPVRYRIDKDTDVKKMFQIDPKNGTITVEKPLDRESAAWHNLTVTASEMKQSGLSSSVPVFVQVLDVNDNAPRFPREYRPYVCEGVQSGELVERISAVDKDEPPEGHQFYFTLVPEKRINPNFTLRDNQDNTASILTRRSSFTRQDRHQYLLPVVIADSGVPPLSSTTTVTITVCSCHPAGHCPTGGVEAFALTMGLSIQTLIGVLVCLLMATVLSILMLAVRRHKKHQQGESEEEENEPDPWEAASQKVLRYTEPGVEGDSGAGPPVPLRPHPRRKDRRQWRAEVAASIRLSLRQSCNIGPEDEVFRQFIQDRLFEADHDPYAPPFDCLRTYAFEGIGSSAGSLSSLESVATEVNAEQPRDPGPPFVRLTLWHGHTEEETNF
ncbi:cadherin-7-like isoform X1 [Arapaima gigas]